MQGSYQQTIPEVSISAAFRNGWGQLWNNFLLLLVIVIISIAISLPVVGEAVIGMGNAGGALMEEGDRGTAQAAGAGIALLFGFMSLVYSLFIINPVSVGAGYAFLRAARNDPLDIRDMFAGFSVYINAVLVLFLYGLLVGIGLIFLIIPGIFFACKFIFAPYIVVDKHMNVIEALQESWDMTKGHAFKVFIIGLFSIPIGMIGFMCLIIGVIPAAMWIEMTFASLYHAINIDEEAAIYV